LFQTSNLNVSAPTQLLVHLSAAIQHSWWTLLVMVSFWHFFTAVSVKYGSSRI